MDSRACTSPSSVIPTQVSWGQSVRTQGWKQIRGSFIQGNKQQLGQKGSLNHGHLGEKYKVGARNVERWGEATSCVEK